jgi:hypothetical protein
MDQVGSTQYGNAGQRLANATLAEWRVAAEDERLAASEEIVMVVGRFTTPPPDLRQRAVEMEAAISAMAGDGGYDFLSVADAASGCAVLMGYR